MTFDEWWKQSDLKYAEQESAFQAWNAALEEAAGAFADAYREAQREGCDANGAFDCGMEAIDALKEKP